MKNIVLLFFVMTSIGYSQIGIGTNKPNPSAILELSSTKRALVVTRVANTSAIISPVNGMIIYDLSSNCFKSYENGAWTYCGFLNVDTFKNLILVQIGNEGDAPNTIPSVVTTTQLSALGVTGVIPANQGIYQAYIDANPNLFSAPATIPEVQAMITAVNG